MECVERNTALRRQVLGTPEKVYDEQIVIGVRVQDENGHIVNLKNLELRVQKQGVRMWEPLPGGE